MPLSFWQAKKCFCTRKFLSTKNSKVSTAESIFEGYHPLVPGIFPNFRDDMGPFKWCLKVARVADHSLPGSVSACSLKFNIESRPDNKLLLNLGRVV